MNKKWPFIDCDIEKWLNLINNGYQKYIKTGIICSFY